MTRAPSLLEARLRIGNGNGSGSGFDYVTHGREPHFATFCNFCPTLQKVKAQETAPILQIRKRIDLHYDSLSGYFLSKEQSAEGFHMQHGLGRCIAHLGADR